MTNLSICLKNICNDLTPNHELCAPRYDCLSGRYVQKNYVWHKNRSIIRKFINYLLYNDKRLFFNILR